MVVGLFKKAEVLKCCGKAECEAQINVSPRTFA